MGTALREARLATGLDQAEVASRSGLSQVHISRLEHGTQDGASLRTWACVASAVGQQLVVFLEDAPGAGRPRDLEHLRRQNALIEAVRPGGWRSLPEFAVDSVSHRSRSIDVALLQPTTGEAVVAEIWDWLDDVGAGLRSLDSKVAALTNRLALRQHPGDACGSCGLCMSCGTRGGTGA